MRLDKTFILNVIDFTKIDKKAILLITYSNINVY